MTHANEKLENAWAWADDGCLTEGAIAAIADGEEGLFDDTTEWFAHLEQCQYCARCLGQSAARSAEIANLMFAASHVKDPVEAGAAVAREAIIADPVVPIALPEPQIDASPSALAPVLDPLPQIAVRDEAPVIPFFEPARVSRPSFAPVSPRRASANAKPRLPWWGFAVAASVALVGLAPSVQGFFADLARAAGVFMRMAPSMLRAAPEALERAWSPSGTGMGLTWAAAFILMALGASIAKRASRRSIVVNGGK